MKVIFLKDVPRVGKKYDVKEVNDGYATNFLIPRKLAEPATSKSLAMLEIRKKEISIEKEIQEDLLNKNLEEIKNKTVVVKAKSDETGHLFSAIHEKDLVEAMKTQHHVDIAPEFIILKKPIKSLGEFDIPIEIKNKKSSFKLRVEKV
jgi:large subunit ribosomal protein L9